VKNQELRNIRHGEFDKFFGESVGFHITRVMKELARLIECCEPPFNPLYFDPYIPLNSIYFIAFYCTHLLIILLYWLIGISNSYWCSSLFLMQFLDASSYCKHVRGLTYMLLGQSARPRKKSPVCYVRALSASKLAYKRSLQMDNIKSVCFVNADAIYCHLSGIARNTFQCSLFCSAILKKKSKALH
jgi:hypothetical protein